MLNRSARLWSAGFTLLLSVSAAASALTLDEFRALPDNRVAIRTSFGVRSARPLSPTQVEVVIGMSVTGCAAKAEAYRVISNQDGNYAYAKFVMPTMATVRSEAELAGVGNSPFPKYERTIVTLDLPTPMKEGVKYYVITQGVGGEMVTGAHTAGEFEYGAIAAPATTGYSVDLAVLGLRQIEPVGPGIIKLEFGPCYNTIAGMDVASYTVTLGGKSAKILNLGRISKLDTYLPVGWPFKAIPMHEVFLQLDRPIEDGEKVAVEVSKVVTAGAATAVLTFDSKASITNSIKVNQVGYLSDSPAKTGYLGRWMGSFPEIKIGGSDNPSMMMAEEPSFQVCSEQDGQALFTGKAKLIHKAGEKTEGTAKVDHSGENVYLLDFTAFKTPGRFYISIPQVGRSLPFAIGDDVYKNAFEIQAYGVFAQRCGLEFKPPYSAWERIACHKNGITVTTQLRSDRKPIEDLARNVARPVRVLDAFGGHHDAGDYNPRAHLDVAQTLMDAYEMAPRKFYDGQLNIPEKGNGIPDIVDEALWSLRVWIGLQDSDGGVFDGTESAGDPNFIETVELDTRVGDYAFAKDAEGSFRFAGAMAQAARILKLAGSAGANREYLERAVRAYDWAKKNNPQSAKSPLAYAAAQLLHATGQPKYGKDFLAVFNADTIDLEDDDISRAAWAYVNCDSRAADPKAQDACRHAIIARADMFIQHCQTMAYAFIRHPWAPINWATGAYENNLTAIQWAYKLTGDEKYRYWMVRTCDNTLGANPLNLSWVVGLGSRTIRAPLHPSRYSIFGEAVPGTQAEGPVQAGKGYNVIENAYPEIQKDFAILHTFVDAHFAIEMDEGMISAQEKSMATFGLLLPDHK